MSNARTFVEKRYEEDMDLEDAIQTILLTMKEGFEGEMKEDTIQMGLATKEGFKVLSEAEVKDHLSALQ